MTTFLLSAALAVAVPVPMDPKADAALEKKVSPARDKAIKYLKEKQGKGGDWEADAPKAIGFDGGVTALAVLGLLEAGVPANDPVVTKAAEYLFTVKPTKTYVVSLHTQALARAGAKKHIKEVQANADLLLKNAVRKGGKLQGWSYPGNDIADGSNTHFAIMGLHAAAQAGAKVDTDIWGQVRDLYAETQHKTGGWAYHSAGNDAPSGSMTLAALVGLAVAVKYDKQAKAPDAAFEKGMGRLLDLKEWSGKSDAYVWLVTTELGRALGTTEFKAGQATRAWHRDGSEKLVKEQKDDGSWRVGEFGLDKNYPVITTACGLYLLGPPRP